MNTLPPPPSGDEGELDVEDAFGEHDIAYWVWSGTRLVPATPDQIATIREREARERLRVWSDANTHRERSRSRHDVLRQVIVWLRGGPAHVMPALVTRRRLAASVPSGSEPDSAQAGTSADRPAPERSAP